MGTQLVFIHGIGRNEAEERSHIVFAERLKENIAGAQLRLVSWHDLGFSTHRTALSAADSEAPLRPPLEELLARPASPFLFDRLAFLLHIRQRDVTPEHPSWTVQTRWHLTELRYVDVLLDYLGDVEVYLRDAGQRAAIQERVAGEIAAAAANGPTTVISHSLGTLVAYDAVHEHVLDGSVRNFVTLGSPLETLRYLARGTSLITYNLQLSPRLNWLNIYDIKDLVASKLVSGDFAHEPRDDWLVRMRLSLRELDLVREGSDEVQPLDHFWHGRDCTGLRTNVAINRESTAFEGHIDYWKFSHNHGCVVRLIAGLVEHAEEG